MKKLYFASAFNTGRFAMVRARDRMAAMRKLERQWAGEKWQRIWSIELDAHWGRGDIWDLTCQRDHKARHEYD